MPFAALFPGQGSQSLGMLADLAASHAIIGHTFEAASDGFGLDLWRLCQSGEAAQINLTVNTQALMLTADVAVWRLWLEQSDNCLPTAGAGHSLGEYAALCAAGVIPFESAVAWVKHRAELMQSAVPEGKGSMAAILGLDDIEVMSLCKEASEQSQLVVEAVNFNSPGQVVLAGHTEAVAMLIALAKEAGAKKSMLLPVSVPSHCSLMRPAAHQLALLFDESVLGLGQFDVLHNVHAKKSNSKTETLDALTEQLYKPVRWVDIINRLHRDYQCEHFIEFGPGKVLTGLNRRINRQFESICIYDNQSLETALQWAQTNAAE